MSFYFASFRNLKPLFIFRFMAIWWPLRSQLTKGKAYIVIMVIWTFSLGITVPWALFFDLIAPFSQFPAVQLCLEMWPGQLDGDLYFLTANLLTCYVIPLFWITFCYVLIWIKVWNRNMPGDTKDKQVEKMQQRSKFKVVKMLIVVVLTFAISWLPLYCIFARIKYIARTGGEQSAAEEQLLSIITPIAQWLGASNSCINPILYAIFNQKYRRGFMAIIKSRSCCGKIQTMDYQSRNSTMKTSIYYSIRKNVISHNTTLPRSYAQPMKSNLLRRSPTNTAV